jgi:putative copper export protein
LIKLGLFAAIVLLGAFNRQRLVPKLRALAADGARAGGTGWTLRRSLRLEVLVPATVLGTTGVLAGLAPATARSKGPSSTRATARNTTASRN